MCANSLFGKVSPFSQKPDLQRKKEIRLSGSNRRPAVYKTKKPELLSLVSCRLKQEAASVLRLMLYENFLRPLAFRLPPEWIHHTSLQLLSCPALTAPLARIAYEYDASLTRELWGLRFRNPIGLAAGFDKNGQALAAWENLGFGFAEVGTITRHSQPGNPRPRLFRIPEAGAIINRLGFPNRGAEALAGEFQRIQAAGGWPTIPIGINIGKSKITPLEEVPEDYLFSFNALRPYADYFVVNVSSPNTPGLRQLQQRSFLDAILKPLCQANAAGGKKVPLLVKIAPDLDHSQIAEVLGSVLDLGLDGLVATNTTLDKSSVRLKEEGGLSGRPLAQKSTEILRWIFKETGGRLPLIGVGGIFTADDAREKLDAGASLLQLYTGFVYEGPLAATKICAGLLRNTAGR
jgi:dihydroorotate dehydrogenase